MNSMMPRVQLSPRELALLLFEWPIKQSPRLALPVCILVAAIVQVGIIFLFSISYKAPSEPPPVVPQVYFLPPDSPAALQLTPWLEANDPAVFSPLRAAQEALPSPPPLKYRPSYEEPPPPLLPLPPVVSATMEPPSLPLLGGIAGRQLSCGETLKRSHSQSVEPPTVVRWQDDLAGRLLPGMAALPPPTAASPEAKPVLFQLGISPEGMPMHCVLLESSGDPRSDEAAQIWIMARRFQPALTGDWGRVTVLWGASPSTGVNKPTSTP